MWTEIKSWLLGLENADKITIEDVNLAAPWAQGTGMFWVLMACVAVFVLSLVFYYRFQTRGTAQTRTFLGVCRGLLLVLLVLTLAEPVIHMISEENPPQLLYVLFDGTDSMAIEDDLNAKEKDELSQAIGVKDAKELPKSRIKLVEGLLKKEDQNLLQRIQEEKKYQIEAYVFDGQTTSQLRKLRNNEDDSEEIDGEFLAGQLSTTGQVTAIGTVINNLNQKVGRGRLAGVLMFSDFAQNSGMAAIGGDSNLRQSPVSQLKVPIYTVGIGATKAVDLGVEVQPPLKMKRAEATTIRVKWTQTGLDDAEFKVVVKARPLGGDTGFGGQEKEIVVGRETVKTQGNKVDYVDINYTPKDAGRYEFIAEVEPIEGEYEENNRSTREVNIIDDYLRLMYVAYEPNWEWRFVKEVFHRDKLVGMRGFRTYLRSADPKVREEKELFLATLTTEASKFFANDIIFLGDMKKEALSPTFYKNTERFVSEFGGGLVVIAGPRFGPGQLAGSPLAKMLPVEVDPSGEIQDDQEFAMQITSLGKQTDFMQLGDPENPNENLVAWNNMGKLPWYQPVKRLHPLAYVLAEHPTDTCDDNETKQPLIAYRRYGRGEVIYLGFDETWRLRRKYGERYYRQFWSQIMNRLALSHALGNQKRFVVRTDRQKYHPDDNIILNVEAYDEDFKRLDFDLHKDKFPTEDDRKLTARVTLPGSSTELDRTITLSRTRDGEFEARIPARAPGEYSVRVKDPFTKEDSEVRFRVANPSAERRSAIRNVHLQTQLANNSSGKSYELSNADELLDDLELKKIRDITDHNSPLWATPLWFILVIGLMVVEWFFRKMNNLT